MWITPSSIRSDFSLESGCSTKDCTPDLDSWASEAERSCTLNGKLTQSASWKRGWKKEAYLQRLSGGAICANSTQASFTAWWIASLRASRAKTCHSLVGGQGLMESAAASSLKSAALPTIAVRDTSFWRTSQASLLPPPPLWTKPKALLTNAQPPASWENWPTSGGMRSGSLFQRQTLVPATAGRGGFAGHGKTWLTPNVPNGGRAVSAELVASKGMTEDGQKLTVGLESQSRYWTTPDVCSGARDMSKIDPEAQKRANTKRTTGLPTEAQNWPTPNVCSPNSMRGNPQDPEKRKAAGHQSNLQDVAGYWRPESSHQAQPTQHGPESSSSGPTSPRRLNPAFTAWLMGWPTTWTTAAPSASSAAATELWRLKLHSLLSDLCGGCANENALPDLWAADAQTGGDAGSGRNRACMRFEGCAAPTPRASQEVISDKRETASPGVF